MCSYKSLLPQSCSQYSQTERRTRQECAATSPYCLSPAVSTNRQREELDRNVQLQVLIASALSVGTHRSERRTRQECAATSPYCLSPAVGTHRQREELDRNVQLQVLIASVLQSVLTDQREELDRNVQLQVLIASVLQSVLTDRREELDRNVQLQVLIASALQSVLRDREKNQIGMFSYKSLLTQSCSQYSQTERRTRQECAATSPYCLSPVVSTKRQREELDRNVQLQVLIASALQSVLRDREKNQIGMCSYKSLLPQVLQSVLTNQREELDRNIQLQVLIASVLQSVLTDREQNQIGMCSYKSLLPQSCSHYSETERRTRQECAATSPYCQSLQSVLTDGEKNQIGMCSYKSLLPQPCSQY